MCHAFAVTQKLYKRLTFDLVLTRKYNIDKPDTVSIQLFSIMDSDSLRDLESHERISRSYDNSVTEAYQALGIGNPVSPTSGSAAGRQTLEECACSEETLPCRGVDIGSVTRSKERRAATVNYVGALQELCIARRWGFPKYTFHDLKSFSEIKCCAECSMGPYKMIGTGTNKRLAKRLAARQMYDYVLNLSPDHEAVRRGKLSGHQSLFNECSGYKHTQMAANDAKRERMFYERLKSSANLVLSPATANDDVRPSETMKNLKVVAEKLKLPLTCAIKADEHTLNSANPRYQCQLFFDPFVVYSGTGETVMKATAAAAYSALEHIKCRSRDETD